MTLVELLGLVFLWIGVFFCAVGVLGMMRFPDVYTRLHATGKVSTLGLCGLLVGAALMLPGTTLKVIALGLFILLVSPVSSHSIAAAAYRQRVPMRQPVRDDLTERIEQAERMHAAEENAET
jgi:multicomponent Na+:H+ antiporter subunit G